MPAVLERSVRVSTLDRSHAVPDAFAGAALAFALVSLVVVLLHTFMFVRGTSVSEVRALLRIAPFNLVAIVLLHVGGALGGDVQWVSSWDAAS